MTFTRTLLAGVVASLMLSSAAIAQTTAPAPAPAPAAAAPAAMAPAMDKKAVSKECSAEADKQGLKGKPRKAFRSKCKSQKMKGAM